MACAKSERRIMAISDDQEMELLETTSETKRVAIGVILAALYAVLAVLPLSAFIGAASIISFAICIAPLFGIILGPVRGFGFGLIGAILATILLTVMPANIYLVIPTIILGPAIAGLFTGLMVHRKIKFGPLLTALYLFLIIILFVIPRPSAWIFMTPYILALVVALVLQFVGVEFDLTKVGVTKYLQILPYTFIGAMLDHSMMAMGSVYILQLEASLFIGIFPLMVLERTIATVLAAILGWVVLTVLQGELT
jgi:hypothetical protein